MQTPLQELESTYFTLRDQLDMLAQGCQTQPQRDTLSSQYVLARQNYWACINKAFHDDDPQVATLTSQIDTGNQALKHSVAQMGDIAKVLNDLTTLVSIGSQLAAKVITL